MSHELVTQTNDVKDKIDGLTRRQIVGAEGVLAKVEPRGLPRIITSI